MENISFGNDARMKEYADSINQFRLPRWEQIPSLGLYMDQVVTVIDQALSPLIGFNDEAIITPSMINNYVKLGMVPKPEKKKYSREHLACLIVITILKQATAIGDIRLGIDTAIRNGEKDVCYNSFCDYVERAVRLVIQSAMCTDENVSLSFDYSFNSQHTMITMAVFAFAAKIVTAKMLSILREDSLPDEPEQPKK